ncbi:MAG TPA: HNH endonuclease signature motif containing protein, partial [Acidimicrobiales bacterium]|nr:HNH endonuclease signature motif containing protein [Acidimicrobiales bacterium]
DLMGDALCELVITNGIDVTTITKLGRAIPAALRRALDERDATCVVPGCDATTGLEIDHRIVEVKDNGPTALWNLAKLCAHHHDLRHHGGFTLAGGPGHWRWIPPGADPDPPGPPGPPGPPTTRPRRNARNRRNGTNRTNGRNARNRPDRRPDPAERAPRLFPKQE